MVLFEEAGCAIHCIKVKIDTTTPSGRMVRPVLLAVAEMESENISEFAKAASKTRALRGLRDGAPPFWITEDDDGNYVLSRCNYRFQTRITVGVVPGAQAGLRPISAENPSRPAFSNAYCCRYIMRPRISAPGGRLLRQFRRVGLKSGRLAK
ncbi:MAG: hypothetical protein KatS3mg024_1538 [Armatimonadota bacterium]|nr:MAG: hypothetical protein KatS3mg024_1538 [Armatimonadota bacterium]